ncbi:MAG: hypothetical protein QXI71_01865 [Candidatus Bathyarchaeia archaeon]|nr:hypothetical protein [Candidatus Bathyarchaeota archaeon]
MRLLKYENNVAAVWLEGSTVYVVYTPTPFAEVYVWRAIAGAGGALAYILYKRRIKA